MKRTVVETIKVHGFTLSALINDDYSGLSEYETDCVHALSEYIDNSLVPDIARYNDITQYCVHLSPSDCEGDFTFPEYLPNGHSFDSTEYNLRGQVEYLDIVVMECGL